MIWTEYLGSTLAALSAAIPTNAADVRGGDLQIAMLTRPGVAPSHGKALLSYELRVSNRSDTAVVLRGVAVELPATRTLLARFTSGDLSGRIVNLETGKPHARIAQGETVLIYIEYDAARAPARIVHDISYEREGRREARHAIVDAAPQPGLAVLDAPFRSGTWVAVHQPDWPRGHRRVLVGSGADRTIPGRFAVDFVGVDPAGRITSPTELDTLLRM